MLHLVAYYSGPFPTKKGGLFGIGGTPVFKYLVNPQLYKEQNPAPDNYGVYELDLSSFPTDAELECRIKTELDRILGAVTHSGVIVPKDQIEILVERSVD